MAESYCLKSCADCGRCSGCRAGVYAADCEIAKCCKKMGHTSCETCIRASNCPTRWSRDRMPGLIHERERREVEMRAWYGEKARILAAWVPLAFWGAVVQFSGNLVVRILDEVVTWAEPAELILSTVCLLTMAFGYWRLREADDRFQFVAVYHVLAVVSNVIDALLPDDNVFVTVLGLAMGVVAVIALYKTCTAFRDVLSGIDAQMSEKWENQWKLNKYALIALFGPILLIWMPVIGMIAAAAMIAGAILLLFLAVREIVYLYQTMGVCRAKTDG